MPSKLKTHVRGRMDKTGESYQQALRHVRAQNGTTGISPAAAPTSDLSNADWFPLGRDGLWLEESKWSRNLNAIRDPQVGRHALAALGEYFTPEWSKQQHGFGDLHPVARQSITVGGRYLLLELGLMLLETTNKKRLRERLLRASEYQGVCAELRGGLLLRSAGARLTWEPKKDGPGPDWLAAWPAGQLGVEVKRPRVSVRAEARSRVELDFFSELTQALSGLRLLVDQGIWLTFEPSEQILRNTTTTLGMLDRDGLLALARETARIMQRNMPTPILRGRFSAGPAGDFTIETGAGALPQIQYGMRCLPDDEEHDGKRLFEILQDAASQLRTLPDVPGLVLVDAEGDFGVLNQRSAIHEILRSETWAENLAGVAIVTKTGSVVEGARESRTDTIVHIVPGVRVRALENTLLSGLRLCDRQHFHSDVLIEPAQRCTLTW